MTTSETTQTERMKVLGMLRDGTLTPEQAEVLLRQLEASRVDPSPNIYPGDEAAARGESRLGPVIAERPTPKNPRYLRIRINSDKGDRVNVRVPMALIRTGIGLSKLLPESARDSVQEQGIDLDGLSNLDADELVRALADMTIDVDSHDGAKVELFCE
jgi:hypothetical protein